MCSGLCPIDALVLTIDDVPISEIEAYPHYNSYSKIDDDKCIYCKRCETACPQDGNYCHEKIARTSKLSIW